MRVATCFLLWAHRASVLVLYVLGQRLFYDALSDNKKFLNCQHTLTMTNFPPWEVVVPPHLFKQLAVEVCCAWL